jgi:hypothetical protein
MLVAEHHRSVGNPRSVCRMLVAEDDKVSQSVPEKTAPDKGGNRAPTCRSAAINSRAMQDRTFIKYSACRPPRCCERQCPLSAPKERGGTGLLVRSPRAFPAAHPLTRPARRRPGTAASLLFGLSASPRPKPAVPSLQRARLRNT